MATNAKTKTTPAPAGKKAPRAEGALNAALLEEFKDFPGIDIIERRLENPDMPGTLPIRLNDEPTEQQDPLGKKRRWYLRWINTSQPQRFHTVTKGKGYVAVKWDELASKDDIADRFDGSVEVRRGDRGQEILVKMPMPLYLAVKKRERERVLSRLTSKTAIKDDVANATAKQYGDEAGEFAYSSLVGEVNPPDLPRE